MSFGRREKSATRVNASTSLSFFCTEPLSKDGFTIVLQVGHQIAVKSTTTGLPAAWAAATASGLHFSQARPLGATFERPATAGLDAESGSRHSICFSRA